MKSFKAFFCTTFLLSFILAGCGGGGDNKGKVNGENLNLSVLTLSVGTLSPLFDATIFNYTSEVSSSTISITVSATAEDSSSIVSINGMGDDESAEGSISLSEGTNSVEIMVTAENGNFRTYVVTVTRNVPSLVETVNGSTTTITFPSGTSFKIIEMPTVSPVTVGVVPTFPTGTDDSGLENVPDQFIMAETDTTFQLWKEVYEWATNAARGTAKYIIANPGQNGADSSNNYNGFSVSGSTQYPVTKVNWNDAIIWCNALTEYYNAYNGSGEDLACVYCSDSEYKIPIRISMNDDTVQLTPGTQDTPYVNPSAKGFRLPMSREYEFAARYIGTAQPSHSNYLLNDGAYYYKGNSASGATASYMDDSASFAVAVFGSYSNGLSTGITSTALVKSKGANAQGFYDMSGNVCKWTFNLFNVQDFSHVVHGSVFSREAACVQIGDIGYAGNVLSAGVGFRFVRTY